MLHLIQIHLSQGKNDTTYELKLQEFLMLAHLLQQDSMVTQETKIKKNQLSKKNSQCLQSENLTLKTGCITTLTFSRQAEQLTCLQQEFQKKKSMLLFKKWKRKTLTSTDSNQ